MEIVLKKSTENEAELLKNNKLEKKDVSRPLLSMSMQQLGPVVKTLEKYKQGAAKFASLPVRN